jgi:hypothetical protein
MHTIIINNNIKAPYKPEELDRLLWLAAKGIAIADPEFSHKDNVRFAMALYSGVYVDHIPLSGMVDNVICALTRYYQYAGIKEFELLELFSPLRTEHALLTKQTWNQDQASERIIAACMSRLRLAQMKDGDKLLVNLSGPQVSYEAVWARIQQEEQRQAEEEKAKNLEVFEQC